MISGVSKVDGCLIAGMILIYLVCTGTRESPLRVTRTNGRTIPPGVGGVRGGGGGGRKPKVTILVLSTPGSDRQEGIRQSWASRQNLDTCHSANIVVNFVIGRKPTDTSKPTKLEGDLLHVDAPEGYYNLGLKVREMLLWAAEQQQPSADLVVKTDDDVFVNIPALCRVIGDGTVVAKYGGQVCSTQAVIRDPNNKFYVSFEEYPGEFYPPYCWGLFYWIRRDALQEMKWELARMGPFRLEDAFVGMVLEAAGVLGPDDDWSTGDGDQFTGTNQLAFHGITPRSMISMLIMTPYQ